MNQIENRQAFAVIERLEITDLTDSIESIGK